MQEGRLTVVSIEFVEEEVDVFDISVEADHSFLVHGAVLHNCPSCAALDLKEWKWGESHPVPALHWGCFVAGTKVQAPRILRGFERPYTGNVIIISTAGGHEVTCTPNHPILTSSGWVAAGDLHEGDEVITSRAGQWAEGTAPNGVEVETSIEDVVTSLLGSRGMVPVPVPLTSEDFHGDVPNQEVATVWTDRALRDELNAALFQHLGELGLEDGCSSGTPGLASEGGEAHFSDGSMFPLTGGVSIAQDAVALLFGRISHALIHGLASVPLNDTGLMKPLDDGTPGDTKHPREFFNAGPIQVAGDHPGRVDLDLPGGPEASRGEDDIHALPVDPHSFGDMRGQHTGLEGIKNRLAVDLPVSDIDPGGNQRLPDLESADAKIALQIIKGEALLVAPDEIVKIDRVWFSGHVYNLETEGNWYVANGIITHNCRCSILSVTKSWETLAKEAHGNSRLAKELDKMPPGNRASMGGPVSGNLRYEDWFNGQSEARQLEILGPGRLSLYKKGGLSFTDMIGQNGNPLTLKQLRKRYA